MCTMHYMAKVGAFLLFVALIVGGWLAFRYETSVSRQGNGRFQAAAVGTIGKAWVTEADSGKSILLPEASRITIELPLSRFASDTLHVSRAGILSETAGANARMGNWARSFDAVAVGSTTITVPALHGIGVQDFSLHVRVLPPQTSSTTTSS